MRKFPIALLATAVVAATAVSLSLAQQGDDIAVIGFTETSRSATGTAEPPHQVEMWIEHQDDVVHDLRSRVSAGGRVLEERRWQASEPDRVVVRDWQNCHETAEPPPHPGSLSFRSLLSDTFGALDIPANVEKAADGSVSWDTPQDDLRLRVTDHGRPYPDRTLELFNSDGELASVINQTTLTTAAAMPEWTRRPCAPVDHPAP